MKIIDAIINNPEESRKQCLPDLAIQAGMLDLFEKNGKRQKSNFRFQFWEHENHPVLLNKIEMYNQRFNYLHENPERAGFVKHPKDWKHSSAIDYYTEEGKGLLELVRLD